LFNVFFFSSSLFFFSVSLSLFPPDFEDKYKRTGKRRHHHHRRRHEESEDEVEKESGGSCLAVVGPSGCGKTSAIYGICEELGLKVLEVNPSTKRGGKDVIEMLGESTQSHTVLQDYSAIEMRNELEELERRATRRNKRQQQQHHKKKKGVPATGTAGGTKRKVGEESKESKENQKKKELEHLLEQQQQKPVLSKVSVILCEEVDILFEEDRGFWAGLNTLSKLSKRPIIITCNGILPPFLLIFSLFIYLFISSFAHPSSLWSPFFHGRKCARPASHSGFLHPPGCRVQISPKQGVP